MTPEQFKDWRKLMGFRSRAAAAEALGISASSVELYEVGVRRDNGDKVVIPAHIEQSCERLLGSKLATGHDRLPVYLHGSAHYSFRGQEQAAPHGYLVVPRPNAMICRTDGVEYLEFGESANRLLLRFAIEAARQEMHGLSWVVAPSLYS